MAGVFILALAIVLWIITHLIQDESEEQRQERQFQDMCNDVIRAEDCFAVLISPVITQWHERLGDGWQFAICFTLCGKEETEEQIIHVVTLRPEEASAAALHDATLQTLEKSAELYLRLQKVTTTPIIFGVGMFMSTSDSPLGSHLTESERRFCLEALPGLKAIS